MHIKINKVNRFFSLGAPVLLVFLSNLFIAFESKLLTNLGKLSIAKRIAKFVSLFKLPKILHRNQTD